MIERVDVSRVWSDLLSSKPKAIRGGRHELLPLRAALSAVFSLGFALVLTACSLLPSPLAEDSDFVGAWVHDDGTSHSSLDLQSDGTFELTNIPASVLDGKWKPGDGSPEISVAGEWKLQSGKLHITLPPDSSSIFDGTYISIEGRAPGWRLYFGEGNEKDGYLCYLFLRTDSDPEKSEFQECVLRG